MPLPVNTNNGPSVDPSKFDLIRGHLLGKGMSETAVDNLTTTLLEIINNQNLSVTDLIELLDTDDNIKLNTMLCILLNTDRNHTSIVGYTPPHIVPPMVKRTILA